MSRAKIEWHEAAHSILRGTLYPIGHERSLSNRHLEHGHTQEKFRFCVQIAFLHFNFLVLTLKSRCYFVYDIFAIVRMPLRRNVLECFTARFIAVGA